MMPGLPKDGVARAIDAHGRLIIGAPLGRSRNSIPDPRCAATNGFTSKLCCYFGSSDGTVLHRSARRLAGGREADPQHALRRVDGAFDDEMCSCLGPGSAKEPKSMVVRSTVRRG